MSALTAFECFLRMTLLLQSKGAYDSFCSGFLPFESQLL